MSTALRCLAAALLLGVLADALLRVGPWGLNATLCACALAACLAVFAPAGRKRWALPIAAFGLFFVWRDSPVLKALDVLAIGTVCVTIALPLAVERPSRTAFVHYLAALCDSAAGAIAGAPQLVWKEMDVGNRGAPSLQSKQPWSNVASSSAIGLVIAIPLLLVFGILFASADFAFRAFIQDIADLEWQDLGEHAAVIGIVFWAMAGFLRVLAFNARADFPVERTAATLRFESLALLIPLALLNALFITFVCVQFKYFFGGNALIADPIGPTYAEHARQGFFQLVAVAALALLVLYAGDWLNRGAKPTARRWFRVLAALLIVLVYIVMASALHRMYLYYEAYGLTQLRFYTTVFMFWLAIVIAMFASTVLSGMRERFFFAAASTAWAAVVALHAINPDAAIARANIARLEIGESFDASYNGSLSADAIHALVAAGETHAGSAKDAIESAIARWTRGEGYDDHGWRTWNWSRSQANSTVHSAGIGPKWTGE